MLLVIVCITIFPVKVNAVDTKAENITSKSKIILNNTVNKSIVDANRKTKYDCKKDEQLKITADNIGYVYIIFNTPPSEYFAKIGEQTIECGKNGFMHELIKIEDTGVNEITFSLPKITICDVYVYTKGVLPNEVQDWSKPYEDCDMLAVPTHADDEMLYFGGVLAKYSENYKVQVAYLTNHWAEWYRPHELLDGLWTVGIRAYPIISEFKDKYSNSLENAKTLYNQDDVLKYQVELIRRFKPEVIIDHDVNGEYGHGVHRLNTYLMQQAVKLAGDNSKYNDIIYEPFSPQKLYLHLYSENSFVMDVDTKLGNGMTAFETATKGFKCHESQQKWFKVEKTGKYDMRKFGLAYTTVGKDTVLKNGDVNMFENIELSDVKIVSSETSSESSSSALSSENESKTENKENTKMNITTNDILIIVVALVFLALLIVGIVIFIKVNKALGKNEEKFKEELQNENNEDKGEDNEIEDKKDSDSNQK